MYSVFLHSSILKTFNFDLIPFFKPQLFRLAFIVQPFPLIAQVSAFICSWCFRFLRKCLCPSIFQSRLLVFRPSLPISCRLLVFRPHSIELLVFSLFATLFFSLIVPAFGVPACVCALRCSLSTCQLSWTQLFLFNKLHWSVKKKKKQSRKKRVY